MWKNFDNWFAGAVIVLCVGFAGYSMYTIAEAMPAAKKGIESMVLGR